MQQYILYARCEYNAAMLKANCAECRAIAEELHQAYRAAESSKPDFEERWAKLVEILSNEESLGIIGVRREARSPMVDKVLDALLKLFAHHEETGHMPFSKT